MLNIETATSIGLGLITFLGAYLIGSIASAVLVCRLMNLPDPRSSGSKNPGATNVLRIGGKKAAAITLFGDACKGWLPVAICQLGLVIMPSSVNHSMLLACSALGAFGGHLYPVFFGFKGGKGIATAFGVLLGLAWPVFVAVALSWLLVAAVFRYSSLAALSAFAMAPLYLHWLQHTPTLVVAISIMSIMIFWRHRGNINKLLHGQESRIGEKIAPR